MSEDTRNDAAERRGGSREADEDARRNRTIRFSDSEWEEVKRTARAARSAGADRVRPPDHSGAVARTPAGGATPPPAPSLAPLIERMFRYTWFLATEKRDAMIREGREEEVDALVAEARALHDRLRRGTAG